MALTTTQDLVATFGRVAKGLETAGIAAAVESARLIQSSVERRIESTIGSDRILSGTTRNSWGKGRKPKPIVVKVHATRRNLNSENPTLLVSAKGPLHLREHDIAPHTVVSHWITGPARLRRNKKGKLVESRRKIGKAQRTAAVEMGLSASGGGRRAVLHWGNVYARYTSAHSKGTHMWRSGVKDATPQLAAIHARTQRAALMHAVTSR